MSDKQESIGARIARKLGGHVHHAAEDKLATAINEAVDRERQRAEQAEHMVESQRGRIDAMNVEEARLRAAVGKAERELADVREHLRDTQQRNGGNIAKLERAEAGLRREQRLRQTAERERDEAQRMYELRVESFDQLWAQAVKDHGRLARLTEAGQAVCDAWGVVGCTQAHISALRAVLPEQARGEASEAATADDEPRCPTCGDTRDGKDGARFCSNGFHVAPAEQARGEASEHAPGSYADVVSGAMNEPTTADDDEKCPMCDATDPAERRELPRPGGTTSPCMNEWHDPRTLEEWRAEALASRQVVRSYMRACNDMANSDGATYEDEVIDEMIAHEEVGAEPPPADDEARALNERIDAAIERISSGSAPMRVPVDPTDPDVVLSDCKRALAAVRRETAERVRREERGLWRCMEIPLQRALDELGPHDTQQPINVTVTWTTGVDTVHSMLTAIRASDEGGASC